MVRKISETIGYLLFGLLLFLSVYSFVTLEVIKKDYANYLGYTYFVVSTGSMADEININDIVVVKIGDRYTTNDVITFKSDKAIITHRVVGINEKDLITKGDANNTPDDPIKKEQVIGRVVFHFSSSVIIKIFGFLLLSFIIISLVNFESLFKKYVFKEESGKVKELTDDLMKIKRPRKGQKEVEISSKDGTKFYDAILKIISVDIERIEVLSKEQREKLKYLYRLCILIKNKNNDELDNTINNPSFEELYNYDFEKIHFTKDIENFLYKLPITSYLKILLVSCVYGNDNYFDAVYKVMKYKILVDKNKSFTNKAPVTELNRIIKTVDSISKEIELDLSKEEDYIKALDVVSK